MRPRTLCPAAAVSVSEAPEKRLFYVLLQVMLHHQHFGRKRSCDIATGRNGKKTNQKVYPCVIAASSAAGLGWISRGRWGRGGGGSYEEYDEQRRMTRVSKRQRNCGTIQRKCGQDRVMVRDGNKETHPQCNGQIVIECWHCRRRRHGFRVCGDLRWGVKRFLIKVCANWADSWKLEEEEGS